MAGSVRVSPDYSRLAVEKECAAARGLQQQQQTQAAATTAHLDVVTEREPPGKDARVLIAPLIADFRL
jgi:hypothetical protein